MGRVNERTLKMMEAFMELHNAGWSIEEIANKFELSPSTVRNHLQEIADANGVTREELLKQVHAKPVCYVRSFEPVSPVDIEEFSRHFESIFEGIEALIAMIDHEIEKEEKAAIELKGRVEEWN